MLNPNLQYQNLRLITDHRWRKMNYYFVANVIILQSVLVYVVSVDFKHIFHKKVLQRFMIASCFQQLQYNRTLRNNGKDTFPYHWPLRV